ncbi:MAG: transglutaminase-like cysteine peptidase [Desulfofustis sp.]|nr:transglutaminase-like cysteine peptidase [Desulfofustis sp.]MBT8355923.1 transglutaminase-like cysteine peptidase [Desulfofustis sp.]NNF47068.1 sulfate adenylyltransferase [Desulfofustis sp.]NNK56050.1 sulfate adenylyltransferase [Desulfofustis sp.]RZW25529.1 MAG: sulfate adenylyltransferase [Desulfobulbaceae bacterium]
MLCITMLSVEARNPFVLDSDMLESVKKKYGIGATTRLIDWQNMINSDQSKNDLEILQKVNDFFNQVKFIDDWLLWKRSDYWATPVEFLVENGGDCEDFSIAKYFTLKKMGVDEEKLNMTYAKALRLNQAHMVVTYYETPGAEPLVLDNLDPEILPASERNDLMPIFSFNGSGLWLAKERSRGRKVGNSDRYKRWMDLLGRMPKGLE